MVVCKFFLQGNCRFGDTCRNEHPRSQPAQNRFAPLQNGGRGRSGAFGQDSPKIEQFGVTTDEIRLDFTHINHDGNRPLWPLSCYAPGKNAPRQLVEGPLEISPEEMRVQCYLARANGKGEEYIQQEAQLINQSQQQAQTILNGLEAARDYVIDGQNTHPNRCDMEIKPTQHFPWINKPGLLQQSSSQQQTGAFGQPSAFSGGSDANTTGGFGQPSSLSAPKPAFGAPTPVGQASAFGQSSVLGGSGPAFGKTAQMGAPSGFGQASKLGGGSSPFGQTSGGSTAFGGASKPAPFGQASQPSQPAFGASGFASAAAKPAFGAPTPSTGAFGQTAQPASPFGQTPQAPSPFGQLPQAPQPSSFGGTQTGASAFGGASALGNKPSPFATAAQSTPQTGTPAFGAPSAFGAAKPSPFAAAASQPPSTSPFGAASQPAASSPFATSNQSASTPAFGAPTQPVAASTGFGAAPKPISGFGASSATSGGFGTAAPTNTSASPFGTTSSTGGFGTAAPTTAPKPMPTTWNGHPVRQEGSLTYYEVPNHDAKDRNAKKRVRIWFPTGPPETKDASYAEAASPEVYEGQLGATLKSLYEFVATNKAFKDGIMPEIPPKREWITWDF